MADMTLTKPAAGAQHIVNAQPDARLLFDFPAGDATLERSGDDLIFRFEDGSSLVLRDFYTSYTRENMPDFVIDGAPVSGEEFFAALNNEDLMPAAGPSNASNADGGRFREYADDPLQVGVDRLGGLDLGSGRAFYPERDPWGGLDDGSSPLPNREPIVNLVGGVGVIEAGVHPGGNDAYEGVPIVTGRVVATDDDGDLLAYGFIDASGQRVTTINAEHGAITIAQDGTFTYTLDNADSDTNGLALGETATETFTIFVDDGRGGFIAQPITVTITGTNDQPELSITGSGQDVVEDGAQSVTGTFEVADPDSDAGRDQTFHIDNANGGTGTDGTRGENGTTDATFTTDYGTLILNPATGEWEYTLDNEGDPVQKLAEGETRTETFTVTVTDEHGATSQQTITVTITGTNDKPVIEKTDDLTLKESGVRDGGNDATLPGGTVTPEGDAHKLIATGKVDASDMDSDDDASSLDYKLRDTDGKPADSIETPYGIVAIGKDGTYTYELKDGAANHLAQGETVTETITVMVTDSHGETVAKDVNVTIYGTNDKPALDIKNAEQDIAEDTAASVGGDFTITDFDSDGANQTITIVGGKETSGTPTEGSRGENAFTDATFTTDYGKLTLNPETRKWTYEIDNESDVVQKLGEGQSKTETFTVTVTDEHGATSQQDITVTITGTNDDPVVDGYTDALTLKEKGVGPENGDPNDVVPGVPTATGTVEASDVDANDPNLSYSLAAGENTSVTSSTTDPDTGVQTIVTQYGTLVLTPGSLTADGKPSYTYALDQRRADTLNAGQTHEENFTLTVTDGHGGTAEVPIHVTIEGTNDRPELAIDNAVQELTEDADISTVSGTFTVTDADADGAFGGQTDGMANQRYNIAGGIAVNGDMTTGTAADSPDAGGPATFTTDYGTLTVNPDGTWTYGLTSGSKALDALKEGETRTETFEVTVTDVHGANHTQTITVNIAGTNDSPALTPVTQHVKDKGVFGEGEVSPNTPTTENNEPDTGHIKDTDHRLEVKGQLQGSDAEGTELTYGVKTGDIVANGTLTLTNPDNPAETTTIKVTDVATDENGKTTIKTEAGTFTIKADGSYSFQLDATEDGFVDKMAQGEKWNLTFGVTASDGKATSDEASLTICIEGTNEQPTLTLDNSTLEVVESGVGRIDKDTVVNNTDDKPETDGNENAQYEGQLSAGGTAAGTDADNDASLTYGLGDKDGNPQYAENADDSVTTAGQYGDLTLKADGTYTYVLRDDELNGLNEGEKQSETFTIYVKDEHGAWTSQEVTVNITGTNDRPELTVSGSGQGVTEDGEISTVSGTFTVKDADADGAFGGQTDGIANQRYSIAGIDGTTGTAKDSPDAGGPATITTDYGTLTVNPDGTWTYALNDKSEALDALKEDETRTEAFEVTVTDVHGANHTQPIIVTITGANDKPVLTPVTQHVKDKGVFGEGEVSPNTPTTENNEPDTGHIKDTEHRLEVEGKLQGFDAEGDTLTFGVKTDDIVANGTMTLTNPDNPAETTTIKVTDVTTYEDGTTIITTEAGTFTIEADGSYRFELDATEGGFVDKMAQGEKWNLTFGVTASDGDLTDEADLTICIEGTNEAPTFTQLAHKDYLGEEQTPVDADGKWVVEAAEQGRWRGVGSNRISDHSDVLTGSFGAADRDNGENANLMFRAEFAGGSTSGGNKEALENLGGLNLKGEVEDLVLTEPRPLAEHADKDTNNYTELAPGTYKVFHFDVGDFYLNVNTGEYYFDVNDGSEFVNRMNLGDTHSLNFTLTITDEHGAFSEHDFTINITGRNDRPALTVEQGISTTDGQIAKGDLNDLVAVEDADLGDSHQFFIVANPTMNGNYPGDYEGRKDDFASNKLGNYNPVSTLKGKYGTLTIDSNTGEYTYHLYTEQENPEAYNAVKSLLDGDMLKDEVFHIAVQDKHGAFDIKELPITITGINDKPIFTNDPSRLSVVEHGVGRVDENTFVDNKDGNSATAGDENANYEGGPFEASGQVSVSDVDHDAVLHLGAAHVDKVNADGTPSGEPGHLPEDAYNKADTTAAETEKTSTEVKGAYGTLTLNSDGSYTYVMDGDDNEALNKLAEGTTAHDTFLIYVKDGEGGWTTQTLIVEVHGTNDRPTLAIDEPDRLLTVTEAANTPKDTVSNTGTAQGDDVDSGDTLTYGIVKADGTVVTELPDDKYGKLVIDKDTGEYKYILNNASKDTQALKEGEKVNPLGEDGKYTIRVTDSHGAYREETVQVEITGVNDNPYSGGSSVTVIESGVKVGGNDENAGKDTSNRVSSNVKDHEGDTLTYSLNAAASDNHNPGSWKGEAGTDSEGWQTYKTDAGTFHIDPVTGKYYFELDNTAQVVQELDQGDEIKRYLDFNVSDGAGGTLHTYVTVYIKGTNDVPTLTLEAPTLTVTENTAPSATGTVTVDDPDKDDAHSFGLTESTSLEGKTPAMSTSKMGNYGTLTIDSKTGEYTYTLDKRAEALGEGVEAEETFHVIVKDKNGAFDIKEVTVNITGTADAIKLTSTDAHVIQITEAGMEFNTNEPNKTTEKDDGTFKINPVDTPDAGGNHLHYGFMVKGEFHEGRYETQYGILTIDSEGHYTFTLNDAANELPAGALETLKNIQLAVRDDRHPEDMTTTQKLEIYIHGTNDRPYFTDGEGNEIKPNENGEVVFTAQPGEGSGPLVENGNQTITGKLTADDPDKNHGSSVNEETDSSRLSFSIALDTDGDGKVDKLVQVAQGKYGILELHEDGTYTYTINKSELLESLNPDEILADEIFDIRVTDPLNASTDGKLTIDVTGTADTPVINEGKHDIWEDSGDDINHATNNPVIKDTSFTLTGIVDAEDMGKDVKWSNEGQIRYAEGSNGKSLGTLIVNPDGTYTYELTENGSALVQGMNEGQTKTETFKVLAVIEGGKKVPHEITITIHGTNDKPVIDTNLAKFEGEVTRDVFDDDKPTDMNPEKTGVIFKGELKGGATDVDNADEQLKYMLVGENGQPVTELKTEFGTIILTHTKNEDGSISTSYTYTLDNESPELIKALKNNPDGLFDKVEIVAVDPHGAVSDEKGTITIKINPGDAGGTGPYDVVIDKNNPQLNANVTEDGTIDNPATSINENSTVTGQIKAVWGNNSVDPGTPAPNLVFGIDDGNGQQVQGSVNGEYGYLVINPATGEYVYTLYNGENGNGDYPVQKLAEGETREESFEIMLNGKPTGEKLTITIYGTNDAPKIDSVTQSTDTLEEDVANGWEGKEVTGTVKGSDIDHFKNEDGTFNAEKTETVTYKFNTTDNVTEETVNGHIVYTLTIAGKGTVTLDSVTGGYTFTASSDIGHIVVGDNSQKVSFQIVATDGKDNSKPADITIKLDGVNHDPTVTVDKIEIKVTEDAIENETTGGLSQTGSLTDLVKDDKGLNELTFEVNGKTVIQGEYGTLVIDNAKGTYTYTLNNADAKVQGLDAKNPGNESFTITVKDRDGGTADITVNVAVTGKDDAPQVTVGEVIKAVEGSEESYQGKVTAADKDAADQGKLEYAFDQKAVADHNAVDGAPEWKLSDNDTTLTTEYGTYKIGPDGNYTFTLNNDSDAVRGLAAGTLTEQTVTVVVTDTQGNSVPQQVTVNISGQNTGPDFMDGEGNRIEPVEGTVTVEANAADDPLQELPGSDDAKFTGQLDIKDPDAGGSVKGFTVDGKPVSGPTTVEGKYGILTINPDGSYTYTYTSDVLAEGQADADSFTIVATDNYGATTEAQLVVNLKGTNDAPVITAASDLNAKEAGVAVTGDVSFTDADEKDTHTFAVKHGEKAEGTTAKGEYGTLTIGEDGTYTYEVTNHELGAGETATESFTVIVKDNHGGEDIKTITVNITGTNDAPVIETASAPAGDNLEGSFSFSDADVNDTHSLSVLIDGKPHDVALNADSNAGTCEVAGVGTFAFTLAGEKNWTYTFTPDKVLTDTLRPGQSGNVDFQIQVSDGHASVPSGDLSVTFQGTNDAPAMNAATDGAAGTLTVTDGDLLLLAVLDKDGNEIAKLDPTNDAPQDVTIDGHTVTFTREADGSYSYKLDGGKAHVGDKAEVSFSIQATDALGSVGTGSLTLVAEGTQNAAPTASNDGKNLELASRLVPENINPDGEVPTVEGQLNDSDPDGDSLTYSAGTLTGSHGSLVLNADGSYTYTLDMSEAHLVGLVMQRGETLTETFAYTVSDGHGGTSEGSITVELKVPDDFSTVAFRRAASFMSDAGNDDAAHAAAGDDLHDTDGLGHQPDDGNALAGGLGAHAGGNTLGTDGTDGINDTDGINVPGTPDGDGGDTPLNTVHLARQGMDSTLGTEDLSGPNGHGTDGLPHTDDGNASDAASLAAHGSTNGTDAGNGASDAAHGTFSGDGSEDQLLGASPFTEDDFGDQDIFGSATHEVFSAPAQSEGFYADMGGLAEAGQLLEAPDKSLDGMLAPSEPQPHGTDDLGLTSLQPGDDLGGGSMPGLVPAETMPDSPDMALAAGAPIPGAEDNLAHQQAMHEVNHSNG